MPEVSVIITTFNRSNYLEEALRSVLNQTYSDFEIIIVDDGSTDNTREVVRRFNDSRIKYIFQENKGVGAARNTGVRASKGRFIAFLDADDLWLPEKLELQVQSLKTNIRAAIVYTDMYFFGAIEPQTPETFFKSMKWPPPRGKVLDKMAIRSFGLPSTLLVKSEVFDKIGLFDEKLPYCDDYDMLIRMSAYFEFEVIPFPLVKYRLHPDQISRNIEPVILNHLTVFKKALQLPVIDRNLLKVFKGRAAWFHLHYALFLTRKGRIGKGLHELIAAAREDVWGLFPFFISLIWRLIHFAFRKISSKVHLSTKFPEIQESIK